MPLTIVRQDITQMKVDAIVNAANTELQMGGGVCGAIFQAAGRKKLQSACEQLAPIEVGEAVATPGFRLPADFVIHTAGPVYRSQDVEQSEALLRACYVNCLNLAVSRGCDSIAFPLISSGVYGYPIKEALAVASSAIQGWLEDEELDVYLVLFDGEAFEISTQVLGDVEAYISANYVKSRSQVRRHLLPVEREALRATDPFVGHDAGPDVTHGGDPFLSSSFLAPGPVAGGDEARGVVDALSNLDEPFSAVLLHLIDAKGQSDIQVYKRANIDRRLFSKIRNGNGYVPSKRTVIALAIALELSLDEADDLLTCAGYALSHSQRFDVIVEYFMVNGMYDIFTINQVPFEYGQPLLGGTSRN